MMKISQTSGFLFFLVTMATTTIVDLLVHGQVTIIFVVSVCLSVCLLCRVFLSRL